MDSSVTNSLATTCVTVGPGSIKRSHIRLGLHLEVMTKPGKHELIARMT